jgi:hypothetical protein
MFVAAEIVHQEHAMTTAPNELSDSAAAATTQVKPLAVPAPPSWAWRRGALILAGAAQLITISALSGADPLAVTWWSLLLAIAPAPLAAAAAFAPAPLNRLAATVGVLVLLAGIAGGILHIGLFFVPALVVLVSSLPRKYVALPSRMRQWWCMVMDASRAVLADRMVQSTSRCTSSWPAAKLCGVNAPISMLLARSLKKLATPSRPARGPYHGAVLLAASAAQSTSSLTRSRIAATSPRPTAS